MCGKSTHLQNNPWVYYCFSGENRLQNSAMSLLNLKTFITHSILSIPSPPPPWATAGHLLTLSVLGVGCSQFYRSPGAGHWHTPGGPRAFDTRFWKIDEFFRKDRDFVKAKASCWRKAIGALKCPYHQNFNFPIWSYISCNEHLRKNFSIWIKSNFVMNV